MLINVPLKIASNKIADLIRFYKDQLQDQYEPGELHAITELVFYHYLGFSKTELLTRQHENLNQSDVLKLYDCCKALAMGVPVQYALGVAEFYGLDFKVDPSVLIPRPETEELVHMVIKDVKDRKEQEAGHRTNDARWQDLRLKAQSTDAGNQDISRRAQEAKDAENSVPKTQDPGLKNSVEESLPTILDIGTGSGCIPVTLKKHIDHSKVFAIDISDKALETAQGNAARLGVEVSFAQADVLGDGGFFEGVHFDIIVSNPPYIKASEAAGMAPQVVDFEPHTALFVDGEDEIVFYKRIIDLCKTRLAGAGWLYVELNPLTANAVIDYAIASCVFAEVLLIRDLSGKLRFLKATR